jgi:hypothetical protein
LLELQERGIERPLIEGELIAADLLDAPRNAIPMQWTERFERFEHHQPEAAIEYVAAIGPCVGSLQLHVWPVNWYGSTDLHRSRSSPIGWTQSPVR